MDRQMDRQMDGQAKNNRAPPTHWRGPKYILGHTDVLLDRHVFCECQYLYILRQKITITLSFIKSLGYRFHGSHTTLKNISRQQNSMKYYPVSKSFKRAILDLHSIHVSN